MSHGTDIHTEMNVAHCIVS